jgi:hypothetical protein
MEHGMSQESIERFLGRIITDGRFRERAKESLEECCSREGYCFSEIEREHLLNIDFRLFSFISTTLDGEILRH